MSTEVKFDNEISKRIRMYRKYNNFNISVEEFIRLDRIRRQKQNRAKLIIKIADAKMFLDIFCKMFSQYLEYNLKKQSIIPEEELNNINKLILNYQKEIDWLNNEQKSIEYKLYNNLFAQAKLEHSRGLEFEKARLADLRSRKKIRQSNYEMDLTSLVKRSHYYETNHSINRDSIRWDNIEDHLNSMM